MKFPAVIFDFNGTLYWDNEYHILAWDIWLKDHGFFFSDDQKHQAIHGKSNREIFENLFKHPLSEKEIHAFIIEKEQAYQSICLEKGVQLADGVCEYLDFLKKKAIPISIATSTVSDNLDFYFQHMNLERWFTRDHIAFNDGSIKTKPAPDLFLKAMSLIGKEGKECIIYEDTPAGILSAEKAGAGQIIIVDSNKGDYSPWPYPVIKSFNADLCYRLIDY